MIRHQPNSSLHNTNSEKYRLRKENKTENHPNTNFTEYT